MSVPVLFRSLLFVFCVLTAVCLGMPLKAQGIAVPESRQPVYVKDALIPAPRIVGGTGKVIELPARLTVYATRKDAPAVQAIIDVINAQGVLSGIKMTADKSKANICCSLDGVTECDKSEAYEMMFVEAPQLMMRANEPCGMFYAWQTLAQLLHANRAKDGWFEVNDFYISDAPRFPWRGMLMDVSRHFFTVAEVKKMIDTMSIFKLNRLHLHLTDGPAWRLEVKKYPRLTSVAAWRQPDKGEWSWKDITLAEKENDPKATYGGFYTREQMKELVAYARARFITIAPEIEMPGHSYAPMHAYDMLVCDGVNFPVEGKNGRDALCMGRPETLQFVKDVVAELKEIFPKGTPVHIGHDEVMCESWQTCKYCQKKLKDIGGKEFKDLNRTFLKEVIAVVRKAGFEPVAWDEATDLDADATLPVTAWRVEETGKAVEKGHPVILCPCSHFYFDYYQADPNTEPKAIGGFISLKQVYEYRLPKFGAEQMKSVRGLQANLWSEYLYTLNAVEYMAWPRGLALAELAWGEEKRGYKDFLQRAKRVEKLLKKLGVNHRPIREAGE